MYKPYRKYKLLRYRGGILTFSWNITLSQMRLETKLWWHNHIIWCGIWTAITKRKGYVSL